MMTFWCIIAYHVIQCCWIFVSLIFPFLQIISYLFFQISTFRFQKFQTFQIFSSFFFPNKNLSILFCFIPPPPPHFLIIVFHILFKHFQPLFFKNLSREFSPNLRFWISDLRSAFIFSDFETCFIFFLTIFNIFIWFERDDVQ